MKMSKQQSPISITMNEIKAIEMIQKWLSNSTAYLSTRTDYARGYKAGIEQAKLIIADILRNAGINEPYPN